MRYTGNDGFIEVGADKVTYIDSWSLDISADVAETNQLGKRSKESIATSIGGSGSISGTLDLEDTAQASIVDMFMNGGTIADVELHLVLKEGTVSNEEFTGQALINGISLGGAVGDKVTFSANYQFNGEITHNVAADV